MPQANKEGGLSVEPKHLRQVDVKRALLAGSYVSEEDMASAEKVARENKVDLRDYLIQKGLVTVDIVGQAVAEDFGIQYADLNSRPPTLEQVQKIPEEIGRKHRLVLFSQKDNVVTVASDEPDTAKAGQLAAVFPGKKIALAYSLSTDIDTALLHYRKQLDTRFAKIVRSSEHAAPELIDEVMADALALRVSDIHFEPQSKAVSVRFRIDDVLQLAGEIPKQYYETIVNRIKVMAGLRTDEHFAAQDGAIRYENEKEKVDLRVSIAPVVDGEKIAIRILSRYVQEFTLGNLGLSQADQDLVRQVSALPFGMILVTGPTGSGKTTTLYSMVKILNDPTVNITTIEDPVEYRIEGVNHIQVNLRTELTFAKGLRSIVRQDPDIILVGEIRDEETADIAVNAALTGHLLFSTFHANDAATSVPRLLDMGIEPFLLSSTLELIIAQRLVRILSEEYRVSYSTTAAEIERRHPGVGQYFPQEGNITLYKGRVDAPSNGFKGRMAIFELIKITPAMEELILSNPSSQEVWKLARQEGARSMFEDGLEKVKQGITTIDEVLRVASPPMEAKV